LAVARAGAIAVELLLLGHRTEQDELRVELRPPRRVSRGGCLARGGGVGED
jgi:hypothetical protein